MALTFFHILSGDSCRPYSTGYLVMVGNHNGLAGYLLKGRPDSFIKSGSALEANIVADFSPADYTIEIVSNNRITKAGYEVFGLCPLLLVTE
ncbi:hypothetical protein ES703_90543 [subsurface metagenome]